MLNLKVTKPLLITIGLLFTACGGGGGSASDTNITNNSNSNLIAEGKNQLPIVNLGDDRKVQINTTVKVYGNAEDRDGVISSYEWTKGEEVLGTTKNIEYIPTKLGVDTIKLTVIDNDGGVASDTIKLEVISEAIYENPLPF